DQRGKILRDHPGVLGGRPFLEAALTVVRQWSLDKCAVRIARRDKPGRTIEEIGPVLRARRHRVVGPPVAERVRELCDGEIIERILERSEERRVGKECRSRWSPY